MHFIILLCATLAFVSAAPKEQELVVIEPKFLSTVQQFIQKCESETKPPADTFKNMLKGHIENDAALKFIHCYLLDAGFLEKDGHFNIARVQGLVKTDSQKAGIDKAFSECNKVNGADHLETLRLLLGCYKDNSPIMFTL